MVNREGLMLCPSSSITIDHYNKSYVARIKTCCSWALVQQMEMILSCIKQPAMLLNARTEQRKANINKVPVKSLRTASFQRAENSALTVGISIAA